MNPTEDGARQSMIVGPNPGMGHLIRGKWRRWVNHPASERTQPRGTHCPAYAVEC
ncbi:MAG: hypothetical protein V1915_00950 [Candidatus Bathyarchaeota archaeon]